MHRSALMRLVLSVGLLVILVVLALCACGGGGGGGGEMSPGERVFRDQSCGSCHELAAAGAAGTAARKLDGANLTPAQVRAAVAGGAKGMPEYVLSASELKALSEFVAIASRAR
jgi:hypothetical protein